MNRNNEQLQRIVFNGMGTYLKMNYFKLVLHLLFLSLGESFFIFYMIVIFTGFFSIIDVNPRLSKIFRVIALGETLSVAYLLI